MDAFSQAELAQLVFVRESVIDDQFQFWLTVTFAVIVANFVAGKRLSMRSRTVIALLYACAVVVFASRWWYVAVEVTELRRQLAALGVTMSFPMVTVASRVVVVALGTAASLIFLLTNWLHDDPEE